MYPETRGMLCGSSLLHVTNDIMSTTRINRINFMLSIVINTMNRFIVLRRYTFELENFPTEIKIED